MNSIATVCVSKKHTEVQEKRGLEFPEMSLVAERPHDTYGTADFIRDDLKVKIISTTVVNHVKMITTELSDISRTFCV